VSTSLSFDDLRGYIQLNGYKPLHSVDYQSDDELHSWLRASVDQIQDREAPRHEIIRANVLRYKGFYDYADNYAPTTNRSTVRRSGGNNYREIYTNHTQDLVETRVTQALFSKPTTEVLPASMEFRDQQSAKTGKAVLETLKYENQMENIYKQSLLNCFTAGESFTFVVWDDSKGAVHPSFKKLKKKDVLLLDSNGDPVRDLDGNPVLVPAPSRIGDVRYFVPMTENVLLLPAYEFQQTPGLFLRTFMHIEDAKKRWPAKEDEIQNENIRDYFNYSLMDYQNLGDYIPIYLFWHRSTREFEKGMFVTFCDTCILEEPRDLDIAPESVDGSEIANIPCERLTDVDVPGEVHGWSAMHNLNRLQSRYDRCRTLTDRNIFLSVHPKWLIPKGECNVDDLGSDGLFVEYTGAVPPRLEVSQPGTEPIYAYSKALLEDMEKTYKIFSITRGSPPPGTRSQAQQLFYAEQQEQRASLFKMKFNNFVVQLDRKTLALCAAKYRNHDERLIRILGADKTWEVKAFNVEDLCSSFNIRISASSALPESRYQRIETLMNLIQVKPDFLSNEQLASMLDFGQVDKFYDQGRIPILAAQREQELLQSGKDVELPERYEDHITHLREHYLFLQTPTFKEAPKERRNVFVEHVEAHEMFAWAKAANNPAYAQLLLTMPMYPSIFVLPPEPAPAPAPLPEAPIPTQAAPAIPQPMEGIPLEQPLNVAPGGM
jgi:hypothetical protein